MAVIDYAIARVGDTYDVKNILDLAREQIKLQKKARTFALEQVLPKAWYYDTQDETPVHLLEEAFDQGLSHSDIAVEYGGNTH